MIQVVRDGINAKFERDDQYKYRCTSALGLGVHLLGFSVSSLLGASESLAWSPPWPR